MYQRIKGLLAVAALAAGTVVAAAGPASAAPAKPVGGNVSADPVGGGAVLVTDDNGRPVDASVLRTAPVGARAITPGATFDGKIGNVSVHFAFAYQWLDKGRSWTFGNARLSMQNDGNLVIYDKRNNKAKWSTRTSGSQATQMLWQPDGNLVVYTAGYAKAVWSSRTNNKCASDESPLLAQQSDSNFVVYCGIVSGGNVYVRAMWASGTVM